MPMEQTSVDALLAPIGGDNPSGKNLRYDSRYAELKEARREDDVLPEGGLATARKLADWPRTAALARQLLEKETKDLQVAAWLAEALLRREGFGGFATGLTVVRELTARFWDTCYPEWDEEDPELRAAPLEWIATKLELAVRQTPIEPHGASFLDYLTSRSVPTQSEADSKSDKREARAAAIADGKPLPEAVDTAIAEAPKAYYKTLVADLDAANAALNALARAADEKLGRDGPSFSKLSAAIDEIKRFAAATLAQKLIDDPDPIVEDVSVGDYAPPSGWTAEGAMPAEPVSGADAAARVAAAARFLRKQDPTNPAPYLMLRGLRWGELRARGADTGSGDGDGVDPRLLEAPATAVRSRLKTALLDEKWDELLEQCEGVMAAPHGRGWLDLQRYVLTACEHLGSGYEPVASAIRGELRTLLTALPRLPEMTLMDDTPTANADTQSWLAAEGLTGDAPAPDDSTRLADSDIGDQTASLVEGITDDDATSEPGGLRAGARRRGRPSSDAASARRDPFALARNELAQGRPNRAIELLSNELARERSPRGRFVRQTQIAYVMVESGLDAAARPILESLAHTIEERRLEEWEAGPLLAQPLALLCRVAAKLDGGVAADPANETYQRVCRLDPLQAIALQRGD
jgi:type VI secretion system protein ImpA